MRILDRIARAITPMSLRPKDTGAPGSITDGVAPGWAPPSTDWDELRQQYADATVVADRVSRVSADIAEAYDTIVMKPRHAEAILIGLAPFLLVLREKADGCSTCGCSLSPAEFSLARPMLARGEAPMKAALQARRWLSDSMPQGELRSELERVGLL